MSGMASSIKDPKQYEALRRDGASKEKAARIANSDRTSSGKKGGKLLTREELSACMATQAKLKKDREALGQREKPLDREKAEIVAEGESIKAARETLDRTSEEAIQAFNQRVLDNDARVDDYNKRNAALKADATAWQAASDQWKTQCGDRRYREDDEIAIKRGK